MRTLLLAVLAAGLLLSPVARAADNYTARDSAGAPFSIKSKECGGSGSGIQCPQMVPSDAAGGPLFVTGNAGAVDTVVRSASVDRGGTITTGGTAQTFMAANASRRGYLIQNQSSGELTVNCLGTAAPNQTSLRIPPGALYQTDAHHSGTGACSIYGATTAQAFYAREF